MTNTRLSLIFVLTLILGAPVDSASLGKVIKTPSEIFTVAVDFSQVVGGDGISLLGVTATNTVTGGDVTSAIVAASPAPAISSAVTINGVVQTCTCAVVRVQGGVNNEQILLDFNVQDLITGERRDGQVTLLVSTGLGH